MNLNKFVAITRKYKKCPACSATNKGTDLRVELLNNTIHIYCNCGKFNKYVDENNNEIKGEMQK